MVLTNINLSVCVSVSPSVCLSVHSCPYLSLSVWLSQSDVSVSHYASVSQSFKCIGFEAPWSCGHNQRYRYRWWSCIQCCEQHRPLGITMIIGRSSLICGGRQILFCLINLYWCQRLRLPSSWGSSSTADHKLTSGRRWEMVFPPFGCSMESPKTVRGCYIFFDGGHTTLTL